MVHFYSWLIFEHLEKADEDMIFAFLLTNDLKFLTKSKSSENLIINQVSTVTIPIVIINKISLYKITMRECFDKFSSTTTFVFVHNKTRI